MFSGEMVTILAPVVLRFWMNRNVVIALPVTERTSRLGQIRQAVESIQ